MPYLSPSHSVKALKGKISHSMDLLTPSSLGGLPTLSLTTNSSWLPWEMVAMPLINQLMPVPCSGMATSNNSPLNLTNCCLSQFKEHTGKPSVVCISTEKDNLKNDIYRKNWAKTILQNNYSNHTSDTFGIEKQNSADVLKSRKAER